MQAKDVVIRCMPLDDTAGAFSKISMKLQRYLHMNNLNINMRMSAVITLWELLTKYQTHHPSSSQNSSDAQHDYPRASSAPDSGCSR
jgi:hypothetical protein